MRPGQALSVSDMYVMFDNVQNRLMEMNNRRQYFEWVFVDKLALWKRRLKVPSPYKVKHCFLCMSALSVDTKYSEEMAEST